MSSKTFAVEANKTSSESKFFINKIQEHLLHADEERLRLEGEVRILTLLQKEYSDFKSFN